jgi:hypothetical protein
MKKQSVIEAVLERSLRSQVKAPRLDGRFDASVWSRIEAAEQRSPVNAIAVPVPDSARWMFIVNGIGAAVALVLLVYFGAQAFGGVQLNVPVVAAPEISATTMNRIMSAGPQVISGASLVFALMFTSLGRRLRAELRQFL